MNTAVQTLKAQVKADLETIAAIFVALERYSDRLGEEDGRK